jgi:putative addiction module killer protein
MLRVVEYVRPDDTSPFGSWLERLDARAAAKVTIAISRLEAGNTSNLKWIGKIAECRIDWGPGYRIYLGKDGESLVVLLAGGTKQRQSADIKMAEQLWQEYRLRKAHESKRKK